MLEWKSIRINDKRFIGMHIILPRQAVYIISSTKCILAGKVFNIQNMTKSSCVFIMSESSSFEKLLTSKVIAMNTKAEEMGYHYGMSGKEVLLYQAEIKKEG